MGSLRPDPAIQEKKTRPSLVDEDRESICLLHEIARKNGGANQDDIAGKTERNEAFLPIICLPEVE